MRLSAIAALLPAVLIFASLSETASARLMTRAEFMPICAKQVHGPTPAQTEAACNCSYDRALMWVPLADVRDIIHEGYRQNGGLAVKTAEVPEARRGTVIAAIKGVQDMILVCMGLALNDKLHPDGTERK